jgi:diguanylate cyclase (GGDEF)-like protein
MGYTPMLSYTLLLLGAGILGYSLYPSSRIIRELPPGLMNLQWKVLRGFILFFIAGYLAYLFLFTSDHGTSRLLVSSIFFSGACFVLLACMLAHGTVRDIRRTVTQETENITDPLMEIFNRRYLDRRMEEEFSRATRYRLPFSLLLIDIDRFKEINDTYGHLIGDLVLKQIGALLKNNIRSVDVPARYGGEEAVILLPHTGPEGAKIVAERIRKTVELYPFPADSSAPPATSLHCTISVGIAAASQECRSPRQLVERADTALSWAKKAGKNRTVVFRQGTETSPS